MASTPAREQCTCPVCELSLIIVRTGEGCTMEYDMSDWARLCRHPGSGSPLVCPALEPLLHAWLDKS
jgi:hypothetical protein